MKNLKVLFTVLCMACATTAWGETATSTFNSKSWGTTNGSDFQWTSNKAGNGFTANQGVQITTGSTGANATTKVSFTNITKIEIQYCTNSKAGKGSISVQVGSGTTQSFSVSAPSSGGTTLKTSTFNYATPETGTIKLSVSCTTNSVYVYSVTITTSSTTETPYSVTFNAGTNGTCSTTSLTETSQGLGVTLPNCNPKTGYTFVGWSTSSSATSADAGKAGETYHPSEDCTLYAVYSAAQNYTVTWVVGSNPSKTHSYTTQVASGSKATPPAELTLTGSEIGDCVDTFVGWSKSTLKSPTNTPPSDLFTDESPESITANTTFYAVFANK